jgi:transcriptional regulator with XRE-family HTH domain
MTCLRIAEIRHKRGLSQAQVAQRLNITNQAYSLYETNKRQMNYATLCMLADLFEVSTDYLLGREDAIPSFLNEEERHILEQYRELDKRGKDSMKATLEFEHSYAPADRQDEQAT